jgi:hypothetical protein
VGQASSLSGSANISEKIFRNCRLQLDRQDACPTTVGQCRLRSSGSIVFGGARLCPAPGGSSRSNPAMAVDAKLFHFFDHEHFDWLNSWNQHLKAATTFR